MSEKTVAEWMTITDSDYETTTRLKVEGGHLYHRLTWENEPQYGETGCMAFVPDIDLTRYQSHLRDAYSAGYADGIEDAKNGSVNPDKILGDNSDNYREVGLAVHTIMNNPNKDKGSE